MKRYTIEFKWTLVFIVVSLLWVLPGKTVGLHGHNIGKYMFASGFFTIPAIWIYVLALKDKKNNYYHREMSFGQGFMSDSIITLILTILSPFRQWLTLCVIRPQYLPDATGHAFRSGYIKDRTGAEAQFSQHYVIRGLVATLFSGAIAPVNIACFLRKRNMGRIG